MWANLPAGASVSWQNKGEIPGQAFFIITRNTFYMIL